MFGNRRNAAQAYSNVGLETGVMTASPHQLITMLFEGALVAILTAKKHMEKNEIAEKGLAISKAIMIIDSGLRGGLNFEAGGELATTLNSLYSYMSQQLMAANLKNKIENLDEVYLLLSDIKNAWLEMGANLTAAKPTQDNQTASYNRPAALGI